MTASGQCEGELRGAEHNEEFWESRPAQFVSQSFLKLHRALENRLGGSARHSLPRAAAIPAH